MQVLTNLIGYSIGAIENLSEGKNYASRKKKANMELANQTLLILGVVLFFGLFLPLFFEKLHLPVTTSLLIVGSVLGPNGLNYVQPDYSLMTFGLLGATFHMLLAGFEAETMHLKFSGKEFWVPLFFSGLIPGFVGIGITLYFNYDIIAALFVGVVFLSSSIMLVFSFIKTANISRLKVGKLMKSTAIVQDVLGTLLAFLIFKSLEPHSRFSLPILFGLLISAVIIFRMFLPEVVTYFFTKIKKSGDEHEERTRLIISLLFVSVFLFSLLDVHPVIAAFLVGFSLSRIPNVRATRNKLHTIGYAVFIPIFLFIIGIEIDLKILTQFDITNILLISILIGSLGASVIGLSVIAIGTSLPELLVSISAVKKGRGGGIVIGNVIGSNIANILLIMGICGSYKSLSISEMTVTNTIPILIFFSLGFMYFIKSDWQIKRLQGFIAVSSYFIFMTFTFISSFG